MDKKPYSSPEVDDFGTVTELTETGQTNVGDDVWPGESGRDGREGGSITHNNAGGN